MIKLTDEQEEIRDFIISQVDNPNGENVIVPGSGGTGKTTMLCIIICDLLKRGYRVAVTAMTGRATAVLREKIWNNIIEQGISVSDKQLLVETISKITKESKVVGLTESGETIYTGTWRSPFEFAQNFDALFVDELSMVPHFISQWWRMGGIRTFGFGDECQLPEVNTKETRAEMESFHHDLKIPMVKYVSGYGIQVLKTLGKYKLLKVLRSDNEIALLCGEERDFKQSKSQMIAHIKKWAEKTPNIQYSTSIKDIEQSNEWQILCYTNEMCKKINNSLCVGGEYPDLVDKILLFDNINPLRKYNGDTLYFYELLDTIKKYNDRAKTKIYVCIKWQNKMPNKNSDNELERHFFNTYVQFKREIEKVSMRRLQGIESIMRNSGYSKIQIDEWLEEIKMIRQLEPDASKCFIEIINRFLKIDRDMAQLIIKKSEELPRLYMLNIGYGYAVTVHKSQGSEYENVCFILEKFDKPLFYTGVSRAKKRLKVIDLTK